MFIEFLVHVGFLFFSSLCNNFSFIHDQLYIHPFIMSCSHKRLQLDIQTMKYSKKLLK